MIISVIFVLFYLLFANEFTLAVINLLVIGFQVLLIILWQYTNVLPNMETDYTNYNSWKIISDAFYALLYLLNTVLLVQLAKKD